MKKIILFFCAMFFLISCDDDIVPNDGICDNITLISPINEELTSDIYPTLEWEGCQPEDELRLFTYCKWAGNHIIEDTIVKGNSYQPSYIYPSMEIFWEVTSGDSTYKGSFLNHYSNKITGNYLTTKTRDKWDGSQHNIVVTENHIMEAELTTSGIDIIFSGSSKRQFLNEYSQVSFWKANMQYMKLYSYEGPSAFTSSRLYYFPENDSISVSIRDGSTSYYFEGKRIN